MPTNCRFPANRTNRRRASSPSGTTLEGTCPSPEFKRGIRNLTLAFYGDRRYFHPCAADQTRNLHSCPCWLGIRNELFIDGVHSRDIIEVREIDRDGDDVRHAEARLFHDLFYGGDCVRCLQRNIRLGQLALRTGPLLTSDVQRASGNVAIAKWHSLSKVDCLCLRLHERFSFVQSCELRTIRHGQRFVKSLLASDFPNDAQRIS